MRRKDKEVTGRQELEEILGRCKTCYLSMVDGGKPYVVPLNFGYSFADDSTLELYFHSALEGRKLDVLKKDQNVCFCISDERGLVQAEMACKSDYRYASIIGNGEVAFLSDPAEKGKALSVLVKHQTGREAEFTSDQTARVCVFKVSSTDFTGKKN